MCLLSVCMRVCGFASAGVHAHMNQKQKTSRWYDLEFPG